VEGVFSPPPAATVEAIRPAPPPGLAVGNMRAVAAAEAARLTGARALLARVPSTDRHRSFAAALHISCRRGLHACRLAFESADGSVVFETVAAASYSLPRRQRFVGRRDVRRHVHQVAELVGPPLLAHRTLVLEELRRFLEEALQLPLARELAVRGALSARRARMAALVQHGLFDRRAERETAARRDTLERALARCDRHLSRLAARLEPRPCAVEPVFTVLLR
jgi:hypothetical protein